MCAFDKATGRGKAGHPWRRARCRSLADRLAAAIAAGDKDVLRSELLWSKQEHLDAVGVAVTVIEA